MKLDILRVRTRFYADNRSNIDPDYNKLSFIIGSDEGRNFAEKLETHNDGPAPGMYEPTRCAGLVLND